MEYTKDLDIKTFQKDLVTWYYEVKRDLPWRKNKDPYRILVSEIMLQQTQVITVIPYYERFLKLFPNTKALANADEQTLLKAWEGLGYYSRARNLQQAAKTIEEEFNGVFPRTHKEILTLKGVGPYTSGAVASIAFDIAAPAVDGNVFRTISRICTVFDDIAKPKTRKVFESIIEEIIDRQDPGAFNQALMELGATICTPKSPKCTSCPVSTHCKAYEQGIDDLLPVKTKANAPSRHRLVVGVIKNQNHEFLIRKRPDTGLLANFYEFLSFEYQGPEEPKNFLQEQLASHFEEISKIQSIGLFNHVFSHRVWEMDCYEVDVIVKSDEFEGIEDMLWITKSDLERIPLITAHQRLLSK